MRISKLTRMQLRMYQRKYGNDARIAKVLGVTRQVIYHRRTQLGIPSLLALKPKRDRQIREMHEQGKTAREIASKFGLSSVQVYRIIR